MRIILKLKVMKSKLQSIREKVDRHYSYLNEEEKKRVVRQYYATWLTRGRTLGSKINPATGKREFHTTGEPIAYLI